MQLTADKIDVSQESGDAFAHGNVKATWLDSGQNGTAGGRARREPAGTACRWAGRARRTPLPQEAQLHRATERGHFPGARAAVAAGQLDCRAGDCD